MSATATIRSEFRNDSAGLIGVTVIDDDGKRRGGVVRPGETIWLSEQEEIATANAPRREEDNPFANGSLVMVTEAREVKNRRPIGSGQHIADAEDIEEETETAVEPSPEEETGAAPQPSGEAEVGSRAQGEEVATPEALDKTKSAGDKPGSRGVTVRTAPPIGGDPSPPEGQAAGVVMTAGGPAYKTPPGEAE